LPGGEGTPLTPRVLSEFLSGPQKVGSCDDEACIKRIGGDQDVPEDSRLAPRESRNRPCAPLTVAGRHVRFLRGCGADRVFVLASVAEKSVDEMARRRQ